MKKLIIAAVMLAGVISSAGAQSWESRSERRIKSSENQHSREMRENREMLRTRSTRDYRPNRANRQNWDRELGRTNRMDDRYNNLPESQQDYETWQRNRSRTGQWDRTIESRRERQEQRRDIQDIMPL